MSLDVDGVDQSGNLGTGVNFDGSKDTASVWSWFRPRAISDARIINKSVDASDAGQTIMLGISTPGGGQVRCIMDGIALTFITAIALNIWHLLVCTYDGITIRLYFNAVEVATIAHTGNVGTDARNTRLGSTGQDTASRPFDGRIADAGISDETFSADFVTTMYSRRGALFIPNRHRWPLNDDAPGVTAGASSIHDIGPQALAPGSGTNSPTFEDQELVFGRMVA